MTAQSNPLVDDAFVDFLLYDVLHAERLCELPAYEHHSKETFELFLDGIRRLARQELLPTYKPMDEEPPAFREGRVVTHPALRDLWQKMVEVGALAGTRPEEVGGHRIPNLVHTLASTYLMAANLSAYGYVGLTHGAAHLIEAFGSDELKETFMRRMYEGRWTGTMALTEPHAGSSLGDIATTATPTDHGYYLIKGSKIFISGADHNFAENVVNLTLARIEGAPSGSKGISLFTVPRLRPESGGLVENDVAVAGLIHKIGWKGLPSLAIEFGDGGDCRAWLVGEPHQGLRYMFQMMNEARLMVGANGASTASVAYHEARAYALDRRQGRKPEDPNGDQVPIVEHADVRRMLLRQKAIVEGSLALLATTAWYADIASHGPESEREQADLLLDILTPIAKTFPAEWGFQANSLAIQIHGGYGYTSEYAVEAYLRDQKLNTLHEGTNGIQALDLLGRKVVQKGGAGLRALAEEILKTIEEARVSGCDSELCDTVRGATDTAASLAVELSLRGQAGDPEGMLGHSWDYMDLMSILVIAWQWLRLASVAKKGSHSLKEARVRGIEAAAKYWIRTEVPRVALLAELCRSSEDSYLEAEPDWF